MEVSFVWLRIIISHTELVLFYFIETKQNWLIASDMDPNIKYPFFVNLLFLWQNPSRLRPLRSSSWPNFASFRRATAWKGTHINGWLISINEHFWMPKSHWKIQKIIQNHRSYGSDWWQHDAHRAHPPPTRLTLRFIAPFIIQKTWWRHTVAEALHKLKIIWKNIRLNE